MRVAPSRPVHTVSEASRFAFRFEPAPSLVSEAECLAFSGEAKQDASHTVGKPSRLAPMGLFAMLISLLPAFADLAPGASNVSTSGVSTGTAYAVVNHLGESDQQVAQRDGLLLSHRRATDPFGNAIRGPFKALPAVVEHATATPTPEVSQTIAPNVPTLEKAVQELTIGAVDVGAHEILIGPRLIREGDLLVLESRGRQFAVWVQSVDVHGVLFCDVDMQKPIPKPFGTGPKELPANSDSGISDIRNFLNKQP
jgi:hypothetical protein